jgi:hypothetical protein
VGEGKRRGWWGKGEGRRKGEEMTQTLYAHINKRKKKISIYKTKYMLHLLNHQPPSPRILPVASLRVFAVNTGVFLGQQMPLLLKNLLLIHIGSSLKSCWSHIPCVHKGWT